MSNALNHRVNSPITQCNSKLNGSSNIPLRKPPLGRCSSSPNSNVRGSTPTPVMNASNAESQRWKQKYNEAEQRRKNILVEKEKILRNFKELEKKYDDLQVKHDNMETELFEKNEEFTKLTTASKNLYREYEILKNQYETEIGAMKTVASEWYKENKQLKRRTLIQADDTLDSVDEGVDACEKDSIPDADLENLNKTIKQLSTEVAELQTELDSLRHTEFQTSEQNIKLSEELELERQRNKQLEHDLTEVRRQNEQILRVSEMMKKELEELQEAERNQRNNADILRREADDYKRERNVLAHQSTLLLQGFNSEEGPDYMLLVGEIEDLKRSLEDERNKHAEEINMLQEKIDDLESTNQVEVLEERIKLIEAELQSALERAETAEEKLKAPPAPPLPPPPPPPPLILSNEPPVVPLRVKRRSRANIHELAQTIGVQPDTVDVEGKKAASGVGVNEDIINAIKQGKFTLRKTKNENSKKEKDTPNAVSELLNILGNLRRAPKKRQSQISCTAPQLVPS